MSAASGPRLARFYTAARRHPWVLGKWADWRIPFGPYNAAQIALAVIGGFVLVKTLSVWTALGPMGGVLVLSTWIVGIWVLRRPRIGGRSPLSAVLGLVSLAGQPAGGRIGQRAARDRPARLLGGGFVLEALPQPAAGAPPPPSRRRPVSRPRPARTSARSRRARAGAVTDPVAGPVSPVQALLARAQFSPDQGAR
ncbi:hypothetical protein [Streptomyces flavofungini]|uniref:Uncharacterized protein n=1 Tax=Streptomyces flavofungini TaxID=68200 RepID=A0ABS0XH78_9ACTN|nr:hypothetical protein [Streptomyces flavofungini]MBJ3812331.1 hypothetical protein [Streptomyces flavofungini]GHC88396.1 hypothetical protein GCM10010349_75650 [Streptomyces flavofungini]